MRGNPTRAIAAGVAAIYLSSCATLIHGGGQQTVSIATDPSGAKIEVGGQSLVAPAEITLSRDHSYQIVATKEGYEESITSIQSRFSWVTVLDLIFIIPWVIDLVSGGGYYLDPDTIQLTLAPTMRGDVPAAQGRPFVPPIVNPGAAPQRSSIVPPVANPNRVVNPNAPTNQPPPFE